MLKWDFTADEVASGGVTYDLSQFLNDLKFDIKKMLDQRTPAEPEAVKKFDLKALANLYFDTYYWLAIDNDLEDLLGFFNEQDPNSNISFDSLKTVRDENPQAPSILKAIFKKKISDSLKKGLSKKQAEAALDSYIQECLKKSDAENRL